MKGLFLGSCPGPLCRGAVYVFYVQGPAPFVYGNFSPCGVVKFEPAFLARIPPVPAVGNEIKRAAFRIRTTISYTGFFNFYFSGFVAVCVEQYRRVNRAFAILCGVLIHFVAFRVLVRLAHWPGEKATKLLKIN